MYVTIIIIIIMVVDEKKCDLDEQVLVLVSKWQTSYDSNRSINPHSNGDYYFLYRCIQFIDFDRNDAFMLEMMFIQACHDMKNMLYPCTDIDIITLLAIYLKSIHGDNLISNEHFMYLCKLS